MSERLEQPREEKKKKLTPAEIYRVAADIYESLPEGQELEVIEALCNMVGRTATPIFVLKACALGVNPKGENDDVAEWSHKWVYLANAL